MSGSLSTGERRGIFCSHSHLQEAKISLFNKICGTVVRRFDCWWEEHSSNRAGIRFAQQWPADDAMSAEPSKWEVGLVSQAPQRMSEQHFWENLALSLTRRATGAGWWNFVNLSFLTVEVEMLTLFLVSVVLSARCLFLGEWSNTIWCWRGCHSPAPCLWLQGWTCNSGLANNSDSLS